MSRTVTERDLRMPEFADAKPEDMEFRDDGTLVRKDRWETGFRSVAYATGCNRRSGFEIDEVVGRVHVLVELEQALHQKIGDDIWDQMQEPFTEKVHLS
jgi:hypothetical protein